ncbi:Rieske (2Fe-2S) protein [Microbacterium sp. X-17]|uniref:aromatic ring-hydroxylating oxygenase subunit alpha n=1 Tax=Microbacterium sp. X-17 TaxID=3144404 RepID=UPI0031F5CB84
MDTQEALRRPDTLSSQEQEIDDAATIARDIETLFRPRWHVAGHIDQLAAPGAYLTFALGDREAVIRRTADGHVHAFYNVCPHRGSLLCEGRTGVASPRAIMCPYHGWTFEPADGALMKAPYMHDDFDLAGWRLYPVHADVWRGLVLVSFADERPASLADAVDADALDGFDGSGWKLATFTSDDVPAAWRTVFESEGATGESAHSWQPGSTIVVGPDRVRVQVSRPTGAGTTVTDQYWLIRDEPTGREAGA